MNEELRVVDQIEIILSKDGIDINKVRFGSIEFFVFDGVIQRIEKNTSKMTKYYFMSESEIAEEKNRRKMRDIEKIEKSFVEGDV